jgi:hypothetical protein
MPDRIVSFTPATGKVAGRTELLIRIHPRVDAFGMLALTSQHRIRLFLRTSFAATNCQSVQQSSGTLNANDYGSLAFRGRVPLLQGLDGMESALDGSFHV